MLQDILKTPLIPWQDGSGDLTDVIADSRIRLSRNLKKYVFPDKATDAELAAVLAEGERYMPSLNTLGRGNYESIHLSDLTSNGKCWQNAIWFRQARFRNRRTGDCCSARMVLSLS